MPACRYVASSVAAIGAAVLLVLVTALPSAAAAAARLARAPAGVANITYHFESADLGCPAGADGTLPEPLMPGETAVAGDFECQGFKVNLTCTLHENGTLTVHDSCSDGGQFDGEPVSAGCSEDKWGDRCCFPNASTSTGTNTGPLFAPLLVKGQSSAAAKPPRS
jgi:hypothetical protein